jgi:hypothetical protein
VVVLCSVAICLVVFAGLVALAVWPPSLGEKTCWDCGGGLPVILSSDGSEDPVYDDWACPKCGTKFDRQGRARNQLAR